MNLITKATYLLAAIALLLIAAAPAHAQLALSYKLEVRNPRVEQPESVVSPCAGLNWVTAIGACGRELFSRVSQGPRPENLAVFEPAPVAALPELPELGRPEPRLLRAGGGKEALIANSKAADLLLRFGSKFRTREGSDGGWEWYRFTDTTYDTYVKTNGHKALGVELLVPFQ